MDRHVKFNSGSCTAVSEKVRSVHEDSSQNSVPQWTEPCQNSELQHRLNRGVNDMIDGVVLKNAVTNLFYLIFWADFLITNLNP